MSKLPNPQSALKIEKNDTRLVKFAPRVVDRIWQVRSELNS